MIYASNELFVFILIIWNLVRHSILYFTSNMNEEITMQSFYLEILMLPAAVSQELICIDIYEMNVERKKWNNKQNAQDWNAFQPNKIMPYISSSGSNSSCWLHFMRVHSQQHKHFSSWYPESFFSFSLK